MKQLGPPVDNLGRQIALTGKLMRDRFNAVMAEHGASLHTWIILLHGLAGDSPSQRELARLLEIEGPTLVRHLDRLEDEGLVERRRDASDRRVVRVTVTPLGRRRFEELRRVAQASNDELASVLTQREHDQLLRLLRRIHTHFSTKETHEHAGR